MASVKQKRRQHDRYLEAKYRNEHPPKEGKANRGYTKAREKGEIAGPMVLDLTNSEPPRTKLGTPYSMNPKQIRARMRRKKRVSLAEWEELYKPIDEWDSEELARGRPRDKNGQFKGRKPQWVTREIHEEAMNRFRMIVEGDMRAHTVTALDVVDSIMRNDDVDEKGRPFVPAGTKLDAAKFLIEHVVGKPKVRSEVDISVKLQGMLATAIVGPGSADEDRMQQVAVSEYEKAFGELPSAGEYNGVIDADVIDEDDDD